MSWQLRVVSRLQFMLVVGLTMLVLFVPLFYSRMLYNEGSLSGDGFMAVVAGMALCLIGVITLLLRLRRPRELILGDETLKLPKMMGGSAVHHAISLADIDAIIDPTQLADNQRHLFFGGEPNEVRLLIVDGEGRCFRIRSRQFGSPAKYQDFCETLADHLERLGHRERIQSGNAREEKLVRRFRAKSTISPVSTVFTALIGIVFAVQWLHAQLVWSNWARWSDDQLIHQGALWVDSVLAGRWDRLLTSALLHDHIFAVFVAGILVITAGHIVERYLGSARAALVLLTGCLAGPIVVLGIGLEYVVFGAWGGGYALMGAGLYLRARRTSEVAIIHRSLTEEYSAVLVAGFLPAMLPDTSLLNIALLGATGLGAGLVTTHLMVSSTPSLSDPPSRSTIAVAAILAIAVIISVVVSFRHLL